MVSILGKTTRGKIVRVLGLMYCLYLDLESPGYMQFSNPIEPFIGVLPVQNLLNCPSNEVISIPAIPGITDLGSKSLTEADLKRKLGDPICLKDGMQYFKIEAFKQKYYLKANINDAGKVIGYKFFKY